MDNEHTIYRSISSFPDGNARVPARVVVVADLENRVVGGLVVHPDVAAAIPLGGSELCAWIERADDRAVVPPAVDVGSAHDLGVSVHPVDIEHDAAPAPEKRADLGTAGRGATPEVACRAGQ